MAFDESPAKAARILQKLLLYVVSKVQSPLFSTLFLLVLGCGVLCVSQRAEG